MIDPLEDMLLEDAMEDAVAESAEDGILEAQELLSAFAENVTNEPLLAQMLNEIKL